MISKSVEEEVRKLVEAILPENVAIEGACLFHAIAARVVLGEPCKLVAGSASWKFTNFDNGSNSTHFSYVFGQPLIFHPGTNMPEMHVWNVYKGKILDFTTLYLPQQCERTTGHKFELPTSDYFYGKAEDKKKHRWSYEEDLTATSMAMEMARVVIEELTGHKYG